MIENITGGTNRAQNCGQPESSARRFSKTSKGPWANGSLKIDPCIEADLESHNANRRQIVGLPGAIVPASALAQAFRLTGHVGFSDAELET